MTSRIDLYSWNTPNGRKITIALAEMGLPYNLHPIKLSAKQNYQPAFTAISPSARIPAIIDPIGPDGQPISIFESGAILLYLARKSGLFLGNSERQRIEVEKWLMWQMGNFGPFCGQAEHFATVAPKHQPPEALAYSQSRYIGETARLYGVLEAQLDNNPYVAGDFLSIADIAIFPWATGWGVQGQDIAQFPNVENWLRRIAARPAVKHGVMVGADLRSDIVSESAAQIILFGARPGQPQAT